MIEKPLQKHTLHLFAGDYQKLRELYPEFGAAFIVRKLTREFLEQVEGLTARERELKIELDTNL